MGTLPAQVSTAVLMTWEYSSCVSEKNSLEFLRIHGRSQDGQEKEVNNLSVIAQLKSVCRKLAGEIKPGKLVKSITTGAACPFGSPDPLQPGTVRFQVGSLSSHSHVTMFSLGQ